MDAWWRLHGRSSSSLASVAWALKLLSQTITCHRPTFLAWATTFRQTSMSSLHYLVCAPLIAFQFAGTLCSYGARWSPKRDFWRSCHVCRPCGSLWVFVRWALQFCEVVTIPAWGVNMTSFLWRIEGHKLSCLRLTNLSPQWMSETTCTPPAIQFPVST